MLQMSVTDETVCIVGVNVVAFTGATVIMAPGLPVTPFQRLTVSFAVHQVGWTCLPVCASLVGQVYPGADQKGLTPTNHAAGACQGE